MAFSPASVVAPLSAPQPRVELADFDHDFGYMVDESDMGYWSSDRECSSDWDLAPTSAGSHSFSGLDFVADFDVDGSDTYLDTDDFEYVQSLLY